MRPRAVPTVFMRGGTSRALFFHRRDLPAAPQPHDNEAWNDIFRAALGSPDPYGRQLNGMGGGQSSLSKIAIVAPSARDDADVEFTFAQVGIIDPSVSYRGTCGNISSAVGPFAVDEGLVVAAGETADVRIFNTNTSKHVVARFAVRDGRSVEAGDYDLPGVAGQAAPIRLSFVEPGGAATGKLLPTGNTVDALRLTDRAVRATLIDAANPVVAVMASDLNLQGHETPGQLRDNAKAMARFEEIRIAAALAMGLVQDAEEAAVRVTNLPLVAILADRRSSADAGEPEADLQVRMISAGLPHGAIPLTGALALAVAAQIPDTLVSQALNDRLTPDRLRIAHASGVIDVAASVESGATGWVAHEAVVFRTARRLMEGRVLLPTAHL